MTMSAVPPRPPKPRILKPNWQSVVALGAAAPIIPANCWYGDWRDELGAYEFKKFTAIKKEEGGNGLYDAVRGPEAALKPLFARASRWNMVGMRMGAAPDGSGCDLLDLDFRKHPECLSWWESVRAKFGPTPKEQTPSGGLHLYIKHRPGQKNVVGAPVPGVDVRGDEGLSWVWALNGFQVEDWHLAFAGCCEWPIDIGIPLSQSSGGDRKKKKAKPAPAQPAQPTTNVVQFPKGAGGTQGTNAGGIYSRPNVQNVAAAALGGLAEPYDRDPPPNTAENTGWVREMLAAIPVDPTAFKALADEIGKAERDVWLDIGRALDWLDWPEGRDLWVEFSKRFGELFDEAGLDSQWASFHTENRDRPITLGTLVHIAKTAGWASRPEPQPPAPDPDKPWQTYAQRGENLGIIPNYTNAKLAISHVFPTRFTYDEFACCVKIERGRVLDEVDDVLGIQEWLQKEGIKRIGKEPVHDAIQACGRANRYHPVREYLEECERKWDKNERVEEFAITHLKAEDKDYARVIVRMFLIGMVARIYEPGCQMDYCPIFESPQGEGKSSFLKVLAGKEYFSANLPDLSHKDSSQHLRDKWMIEIPEMHTFGKATNDQLKAYLTRTHERYRPSHARLEVTEPRQCVFAGTMNPIGGAGYLRDSTGGRRFWPLKVAVTGLIDLDAIARDRDQIFGEAVALYKANEAWWPDREFEKEFIKPEQDARREDDAWRDAIAAWLDKPAVCQCAPPCVPATCKALVPRPRVTVTEVAHQAIGIGADAIGGAVSKLGRADQNRIMAALTDLGWERGDRAANARWWVPKSAKAKDQAK